jgi:predicted Fe-Mo cluster-binding NifX family protein
VKVAVAHAGDSVAPCFGFSGTITIFTIERKRVVDSTDFWLQSRDELDRVRLLRDQGVQVLICGGIQERIEDILTAHDIEVISWVTGTTDELLQAFIRGQLEPGSGRLGCKPDTGQQ